jgi:hypothetical protein
MKSKSKSDKLKCFGEKCKREARWEIGFTVIVHDSNMFEGSGENEFQRYLCDKHFIKLDGCGNVVCFRRIGNKKWKCFDDYDNPFVLRNLVKESYKLYISYKLKLKFKKISNF